MWIKEQGKITNGFYRIGTFSNPMYLLDMGKEWVLIEGGLEINVSLVLTQLKEILPDLSLLKHWFITHSHYDHCGAIESLQQHIPGVKLYASKEAIKNFSNSKYSQKVRQLNRLIKTNLPSEIDQLPETGLHELTFIPLSDGTFSLGGQKDWQIIHTPGHSQCSLSFYYVPKKILFVSDALGEIITPKKWFPLAFESMSFYMKSIYSLDEFKADYIALGHYGVLSAKEARYAVWNALQSCYDMISIANEVVKNQGMTFIHNSIDKEFGKNDRDFIPPHVYTKSISQLINVLTTENFIQQNHEN